MDVGNAESIAAAAQTVADAGTTLTHIIHNAGVIGDDPFTNAFTGVRGKAFHGTTRRRRLPTHLRLSTVFRMPISRDWTFPRCEAIRQSSRGTSMTPMGSRWVSSRRFSPVRWSCLVRYCALQAEAPSMPIIAILSSKVGSVDDNGSGGLYAYRASKVRAEVADKLTVEICTYPPSLRSPQAACNMIAKCLYIDLKRENKATVVLLHPGYVRTDMTGNEGLIDVEESVMGMLKAVEATGPGAAKCQDP
eukprot:scaffold2908_cov257-Pinguiococcus_pyrenoidosus.AAC.36